MKLKHRQNDEENRPGESLETLMVAFHSPSVRNQMNVHPASFQPRQSTPENPGDKQP